MTQISIFAGPSLPSTALPGAKWYGPAEAGDLLALTGGAPHKVLLIDGLFENVRAPWHKEILALLSLGFDIWGAASFGALRAAELQRFGMVPFGGIARAVADGRIVGDDEVAVVHAPAALGYRPLTVAHVDVRATLVAAVRKGILDVSAARAVAALSRSIFYKERTLELLVERTHAASPAFARWLPHGLVPQKFIDAHSALDRLRVAEFCGRKRLKPPETVFLKRLRAGMNHEPRRRQAT